MKKNVTVSGSNVCFFEHLRKEQTLSSRNRVARDNGLWKLCIDLDLLFHTVTEETSEREHHFAETLKVTGNKFILSHTDDALFYRLYRYALDSLTMLLRSCIYNIKFSLVFGGRIRTYATMDSSDIDKNLCFAFVGLVERYLVMKIVSDWYLRCNLTDVYNSCVAELNEVEVKIKNLLSSNTGQIPVDDLNLGLGGCVYV
ncbi:MAG: hypothetical protein LBP85_08490 [Prevotellaceae bacterium]|jgi:hypothetical protein|nr:hypothetical protein [Prevotellaceae bacterium]